MFEDKARSLSWSGAPEMCFAQTGSGLPANIRLGQKGLPGRNTRLLRIFVNYVGKKFYKIGRTGVKYEPTFNRSSFLH